MTPTHFFMAVSAVAAIGIVIALVYERRQRKVRLTR